MWDRVKAGGSDPRAGALDAVLRHQVSILVTQPLLCEDERAAAESWLTLSGALVGQPNPETQALEVWLFSTWVSLTLNVLSEMEFTHQTSRPPRTCHSVVFTIPAGARPLPHPEPTALSSPLSGPPPPPPPEPCVCTASSPDGAPPHVAFGTHLSLRVTSSVPAHTCPCTPATLRHTRTARARARRRARGLRLPSGRWITLLRPSALRTGFPASQAHVGRWSGFQTVPRPGAPGCPHHVSLSTCRAGATRVGPQWRRAVASLAAVGAVGLPGGLLSPVI